MTYRRALVIGGSSGIGAEVVRQLAESGAQVANFSRRPAAERENVRSWTHDVADHGDVPKLFLEATDWLGGLDLVVWATGIMPDVGPDEHSPTKDRATFEVNLLGAVAWLDVASDRFLATGSGTLVVYGSVAGDRGRRGQPAYNASKAALHAFAEGLRNRLSPKGVTVTTIKPGPVETPLIAHLGFRNAMPAAEAARRSIRLFPTGKDVYLKFSHRVIFGIIRLLPTWIMRRLPI